MEPTLETKNLTRVVDGERIVDAVSLRVGEGEVLAFIGPSGAGKSSFLRLLNRLDEPTDGAVYIDGTDYRDIDPQELRQRVGLIPQEPALQPGTVVENVAISDRIRDAPVDEQRVEALLDRVDLSGYEKRDVADLSGGGNTNTHNRYVDQIEDEYGVAAAVGKRESMMDEMWDARGTAFKVIEEGWKDGEKGARRLREREVESLETVLEIANHIAAEFSVEPPEEATLDVEEVASR